METILPYLKPATSSLSICKIWRKAKVPKFGTRNAWKHTNVLKLEFEKSILTFQMKPSNLSSWKKKKNRLNLESKICYLGIFWQELEKYYYCHIWNQHPQVCLFPKIVPNTPDFGIFGWNLKQYCHIWNQPPRMCLIVKFGTKNKSPKFGTKNAWFGFFFFDQKALVWFFFGKNCE